MTKEEAIKRVAEITSISGDYEDAHSKEDSLYADFVHHISVLGVDGVSDVAKEILKTADIDFPRYCA